MVKGFVWTKSKYWNPRGYEKLLEEKLFTYYKIFHTLSKIYNFFFDNTPHKVDKVYQDSTLVITPLGYLTKY